MKSACPGGDCHGLDHAWCAPGKHAGKPAATERRTILNRRPAKPHAYPWSLHAEKESSRYELERLHFGWRPTHRKGEL